jgi:protein gp37
MVDLLQPEFDRLDMTLIAWAHFTFNAWLGCEKVAPPCANCYAVERENKRHGLNPSDAQLTQTWNDPYHWENQLAGSNFAIRCFTCSLSDFFWHQVDNNLLLLPGRNTMLQMHQRPARAWGERMGRFFGEASWRDAAWQVIRDTPHIIYLILTKRPERIHLSLPPDWPDAYPNVWLGTSVGCNLDLARLDSLRKIQVHPEACLFISAEPLLEDISQQINLDRIGWMIVGGESGAGPEHLWNPDEDWQEELKHPRGRRIMKLEWAHALQHMCVMQGIPFFFKQITAWKSEQGKDALGMIYRQYPPPPQGLIWAAKPEVSNPLAVIQ